MKRAQVSIEFILLGVMGFFFLFVVIGAIMVFSADKTKQNTFDELTDLGKSLQQEFLLASKVQNGYQREFSIPETINNLDYSIVIGNSSSSNGYMSLIFSNQEIFYIIPVVNGTMQKGLNVLTKQNNTLQLN